MSTVPAGELTRDQREAFNDAYRRAAPVVWNGKRWHVLARPFQVDPPAFGVFVLEQTDPRTAA